MDIKKKLNQIKDIVSEIETSLPETIKFTESKFLSFYPDNASAAECYKNISEALNNLGILEDLTLIGALATVRVEVGRAFKPIAEYSTGTQYEWRADLGNDRLGDGPRFKGRGYIQITGRRHYTNYGKALGIDLVNHPELALDPKVSAQILALYFRDKGIPIVCKAQNWVQARKLVNGGTNGLSEFQSVVGQYLAKLQ